MVDLSDVDSPFSLAAAGNTNSAVAPRLVSVVMRAQRSSGVGLVMGVSFMEVLNSIATESDMALDLTLLFCKICHFWRDTSLMVFAFAR